MYDLTAAARRAVCMFVYAGVAATVVTRNPAQAAAIALLTWFLWEVGSIVILGLPTDDEDE